MDFIAAYHTDAGIRKNTNQDSLCIKQACTARGNILMAVLCDGMGGLAKGEVASAAVIRAFSHWFEHELPFHLANPDCTGDILCRWERLIKEQNRIIGEYGRANHFQLGSTVTALLILEDGQRLIAHVGDSRAYHITDDELRVLTWDQTLAANEVRLGRLTPEQAGRDPRRNVLLQSIGASRAVEPDLLCDKMNAGECCMLCSDGFCHEVSAGEICAAFAPAVNADEQTMREHIVQLIEANKQRGETDNITAVLIKLV